jgi:hypothetical protein
MVKRYIKRGLGFEFSGLKLHHLCTIVKSVVYSGLKSVKRYFRRSVAKYSICTNMCTQYRSTGQQIFIKDNFTVTSTQTKTPTPDSQ